jgi:hypothetical protein
MEGDYNLLNLENMIIQGEPVNENKSIIRPG